MNSQTNKSTIFERSSIVRKLTLQYVFSLLGYSSLLLLIVYSVWKIFASRIWYGQELLYPILHWLHDNIILVTVIACLVGWLAITLFFVIRTLYFFRQVVAASEHLARKEDSPIRLSTALKDVQDELNLVRDTSLRNELLAKEAEKRKNDLIVYLAHDLKTPLTSVIGYLTLLRDEPQISRELLARYTGIALEKAERLETLLNEFFEITRFNLTMMTLEKEQVHFSRMMEQIASEFMPIMDEKELRWDMHVEPGVELVCDPDKMERVLDNLIRNAINYSYRGSAIVLSMRQVQRAVMFQVINRGKTIPKEKLDRIFEQFFRLDSARATTTGGAGLGLAISKEIVELHGGRITAESEEEMIRFTVWLPVN